MSSFLYRLASGFTSHFHWRNSLLRFQVPASTKHAIFASTTAVLVSFIQMKYENKSFTPFDTHPKTMNASIFNLLLYCVSSIAEANTFNNGAVTVDDTYVVLVCGHISDITALLVVALLASVVLPVPLKWFGFIVLVYIMVRVFFWLLPIGYLKQLVSL